MVAVVDQLCVKSFAVVDPDGTRWKAEQGRFYTTTVPSDDADTVTVFSRYWVPVPKNHFVIREKN